MDETTTVSEYKFAMGVYSIVQQRKTCWIRYFTPSIEDCKVHYGVAITHLDGLNGILLDMACRASTDMLVKTSRGHHYTDEEAAEYMRRQLAIALRECINWLRL